MCFVETILELTVEWHLIRREASCQKRGIYVMIKTSTHHRLQHTLRKLNFWVEMDGGLRGESTNHKHTLQHKLQHIEQQESRMIVNYVYFDFGWLIHWRNINYSYSCHTFFMCVCGEVRAFGDFFYSISCIDIHRNPEVQYKCLLCNVLQHAPAHCNTLQHAATCCNMLQHVSMVIWRLSTASWL